MEGFYRQNLIGKDKKVISKKKKEMFPSGKGTFFDGRGGSVLIR